MGDATETPWISGPWEVRQSDHLPERFARAIWTKGNPAYGVAKLSDGIAVGEVNPTARLIAKAPEMVELIEDMKSYLENWPKRASSPHRDTIKGNVKRAERILHEIRQGGEADE